MTESQLTSKLVRLAKDEGELLVKHSDAFRSGVPDLSFTRNGWTSWWEVKLAKPRVKWKNNLQRHECLKLEEHGCCHLVVYLATDFGLHRASTCIVLPSATSDNGSFTAIRSAENFDHRFVLEYMRFVHQRDPRQPR